MPAKVRETRQKRGDVAALTSIPYKRLVIKRKYKYIHSSPSSPRTQRTQRWWFVVRGDESLLQELDGCWNSVALQTSWQLSPLVQYLPVENVETSCPVADCHNGTIDCNQMQSDA